MANLEETHEAELDAILGELSQLEQRGELRQGRSHSRTNSTISVTTNTTISSESGCSSVPDSAASISSLREPRTDSPDNDSAFSDTVSLMSSESSASSSVSSHLKNLQQNAQNTVDTGKQAKIHLALQKLEQATVRRLFVKAFSVDGASKSLLVDETMSCGHVTRLLADKNHVQMEPSWAIVEHLPEYQMERLFEDHELLVDNLMLWSRDSKNKVLFLQRADKLTLFKTPELFLPGTQMAPGSDHDEHTRAMLLDEFFSTQNQIPLEGPLYLKSDSKKGWKKYHFVLRASGLHYYPKEQKVRSIKDLLCLALFAGHEVYRGIGWKKKHKSPTDYTFALRCPKVSPIAKGTRSIKMLCAEDAKSLETWVTAIRVTKYGKKLLDNHRSLSEDLAREELDKLSSARSGSIGSIVSSVPSHCSSSSSSNSSGSGANHLVPVNNGRLSRASSSSSSGCLSDENNGFDSDFPTGTIKRKPSMKPNLPLTSMTRQLKEVGETTCLNDSSPASPDRGGTLTRRHSRRRSEESNNSGTLKRRPANNRGSMESMSSSTSTPTPTPSNSIPGTPINQQQAPILAINNNLLNNSSSSSNVQQSTTITPPTPTKPITSLESMQGCMSNSTFSLPPPPDDLGTNFSGSTLSLDSLPPPPPPSVLEDSFSGSQLSLVSVQMPLPPPPPNVISVQCVSNMKELGKIYQTVSTSSQDPSTSQIIMTSNENFETNSIKQSIMKFNSQALPSVTNNVCSKVEPIYLTTMKPSALKAPPYKAPPPYNGETTMPQTPPPAPAKNVKFADSPVLLRRKVCFEDEVQEVPLSPRRISRDIYSSPPVPPPRAEATRLSTSYTSPKRLSDSASNPPRDFLKDLQRVMNKKWQIAQKCKLEPATTPHEVLGFRDLPSENYSSHYYRESANVSHWVQEHYGSDGLYENLGSNMGVEPSYPRGQLMVSGSIKKRPPPPPPKRSEKTHLTTTVPQQRL
ncbi:amyloid beta A4 precursor protein-binding family B member 1-interacting protein isoform X3 [Wyeomyia smithii]|nr:amyloid beta A4 precursor protein-binding family B member 1-interacting protein isoform X3 [Wyeomyia smithii]XP_055550439.1 amyloid beta A4 precursor protein-binding family B member 1-interacting protein isoform X3 [Wyeomyia smithii]XP_055550440.1 amyloid beta A4 precursor protein-binding family B member 1-interacting protein isoform X3 [Wyeomyia smithii]